MDDGGSAVWFDNLSSEMTLRDYFPQLNDDDLIKLSIAIHDICAATGNSFIDVVYAIINATKPQ